MKNSEVITIGKGNYPTVGIVGLVHGDEIVGRKVLDRLRTELELKQGQVHLIYANLAAERAGKPQIDKNLNISFPGKPNGNIEERIAYQLREVLSQCHFVMDIHSTSTFQGSFVISTSGLTEETVKANLKGREISKETLEAYKDSGLHPAARGATNIDSITTFSQYTGLKRHLHLKEEVAHGRSLIDFVNSHGKGYGISFEAGEHHDPETENTAMEVVNNVLMAYGLIEGIPTQAKDQEIYFGIGAINLPKGMRSEQFTPSEYLKNFILLPAGVPYGHDHNGRAYSLNKDCVPVLFDEKTREGKEFRSGRIFIRTERIS